jgi:hypothetical protein
MIESALVIFAGFYLIWLVRKSRKYNKDISKLSKVELTEFNNKVNVNPKRYFISGGSATTVPGWVFIALILFFMLVMYYAFSNIS